MKILKSLFLLSVISTGASAQNNRFFFVEAGTCFNAVSAKKFHTEDNHTSTTNFEYKGTIRSLPFYYLKAGFEKVTDLCPKSAISFPVSVNYFNEAQKIEADGGYNGCFASEGGHYSIIRNNHSIAFSLGVKFIGKPTEKISIQNGINISPNTKFLTEDNMKITNEAGTTSTHNLGGYWISGISLSAQSGLFYQMSPKSKIGITAEYFFLNKQIKPKNVYPGIYDFEYGYHGYSALINSGLRFQHSF